MSCLRSDLQIYSGLKIVASEQLAAHLGRASPLIHTVKEMGSILIDQKIDPDTLLSRRFTMHGVEIGINPNQIFAKFMPLGRALAKFAYEFDLFTSDRTANQTIIFPLLRTPPDVSDLVADPESFYEEAKVLGTLNFVQKNVLATHRNGDMTREAHATVLRLFLRYGKRLMKALAVRRRADIEFAVDRMNECADELRKKSSYYPSQATIVKKELMESDDIIKRHLGARIEPHERFVNETGPLSETIVRSSHLIRSLLYRAKLYARVSSPVSVEQTNFVQAFRHAGLGILREEDINNVKELFKLINDAILQRSIWWGVDYGPRSYSCQAKRA